MYFNFSDNCVPPLKPQAAGPRSAARGFTLLEVMVVVAILGILAAIAGPSFTPMIERWRVRQATEDLQSTLYFARSEAIKLGGDVSVQAKSGKDWSSGWQVKDGANKVLQNTDAPKGVIVQLTGNDGTITIDRWGKLDKSALKLSFAPKGADSSSPSASAECIGLGGQITRPAKGTACP